MRRLRRFAASCLSFNIVTQKASAYLGGKLFNTFNTRFARPSSIWLTMSSQLSKPIVAVDIDEVLAQFIPSLAEFHNEVYGGTTLSVDSFVSYEFHRVWGGTAEECGRKMDAFFESTHFKESICPVPYAYEVLHRMKQLYSLHVVTARQHRVEEATKAWLQRYFPNIFDDIHFGNHYCSTGKSRSKAEICKSINAQLLIDDSMIYATQCALEGIAVVLFGKYPWNQHVESAASPFHDITVIFNAHEQNEVVIEDFHENLTIADHVVEEMSAGAHHVYRVTSWQQMEQAVHYMLSSRRNLAMAAISDTSLAHVVPAVDRQQLHVAAIQMCSRNDKMLNLARTTALLEQALEQDPLLSLVCLPECCAYMGLSAAETASQGEELHAEAGYVAALCKLAKDKAVWLSVGGFPEIAKEGKVYNTHLLINRQGELVRPVYRKIHLFDCPLVGLQESKLTAAGDELVVLELEGWVLGMAVCYDLRFPGLFHALQAKARAQGLQGLDLLLLPAAFTVPTGAAHWELLLRARAVENQCYVLAAAQSGQHHAKRASYGHSMAVDPWGKLLGQLHGEEEGVCLAVLDKERIQEVRRSMPIQEHERPDIYQSSSR